MTGGSPEEFERAHWLGDLDTEPYSMHHTLGKGPLQAAPGNHTHPVVPQKPVPLVVPDLLSVPVTYYEGLLVYSQDTKRMHIYTALGWDEVLTENTPKFNDPWHQVGTSGQPAFTAGITGTAGYPPMFRLVNEDTVETRGICNLGTTASGTVMFVLPVGYRPSTVHPSLIFLQDVNPVTAVGRITISPNGNVVWNSKIGTPTTISIAARFDIRA